MTRWTSTAYRPCLMCSGPGARTDYRGGYVHKHCLPDDEKKLRARQERFVTFAAAYFRNIANTEELWK